MSFSPVVLRLSDYLRTAKLSYVRAGRREQIPGRGSYIMAGMDRLWLLRTTPTKLKTLLAVLVLIRQIYPPLSIFAYLFYVYVLK